MAKENTEKEKITTDSMAKKLADWVINRRTSLSLSDQEMKQTIVNTINKFFIKKDENEQ